ncbi:hypothetical protein F4Z99_12735 [Candidatus Poribacteria bacterium]|nr:hypothetical protein [Candidatus Poribacteria bacterium]MYB02517.1 hypothetical protein [Candidatus Poribacteria bacterium]
MQQLEMNLFMPTVIYETQTLINKLTKLCKNAEIPKHKRVFAKKQIQRCLKLLEYLDENSSELVRHIRREKHHYPSKPINQIYYNEEP